MSATTTAQLKHLWAASHALAATSPAVSAHLMTRFLNLSHEKEINLAEAVSRQVCTACGTVAIPGINSRVHSHRRRMMMMKRRNNNCLKRESGDDHDREITQPQKEKMNNISKLQMVYECRACGRSRTQDVPQKPKSKKFRAQSRPPVQSSPQPPPQSSSSTTPIPAEQALSQNAGSKRRAKSRKGNSLSEILAAKKKQDSSSGARGNSVRGFGLDLMDLMKTG